MRTIESLAENSTILSKSTFCRRIRDVATSVLSDFFRVLVESFFVAVESIVVIVMESLEDLLSPMVDEVPMAATASSRLSEGSPMALALMAHKSTHEIIYR